MDKNECTGPNWGQDMIEDSKAARSDVRNASSATMHITHLTQRYMMNNSTIMDIKTITNTKNDVHDKREKNMHIVWQRKYPFVTDRTLLLLTQSRGLFLDKGTSCSRSSQQTHPVEHSESPILASLWRYEAEKPLIIIDVQIGKLRHRREERQSGSVVLRGPAGAVKMVSFSQN